MVVGVKTHSGFEVPFRDKQTLFMDSCVLMISPPLISNSFPQRITILAS